MKKRDSKENELQGLEKEIDHAIDSLFVEKRLGKEKAGSTTGTDAAASEPVRRPEKGTKAGELQGLEKEIDHAVDSLFVETGRGKEKAPTTTMGMTTSESLEAFAAEPNPSETELSPPDQAMGLEMPPTTSESFEAFAAEPNPSETELSAPDQAMELEMPPAEQERVVEAPDRATRNLENLETHLLSLEWEISPDLIDKIISELGFLKDTYKNNHAVFQVIDVMGKVARSLADDEGNITPESLRFLLEAKDGIKLLGEELRDKEGYRNVVLSGILARYQVMQTQGKKLAEGKDYPGPRGEFVGLAESLKALSTQLQDGIHQLGSIAQKLRGRESATPSRETVGAVLVESCGRVFAIEKEKVIRSVQIPYRMVKTIWKDREIRIRGMRLPLVNLFRLFKFKGRVEAKDKAVVMVKKGDRVLAILVDRLLQKREVPLNRIREGKGLAYIGGIASISRGRNIYFLDIDRLMVEF